jgi:fatty acid desaturase
LSFGISFLRVWQSSKLDVGRAKRQMAMGAIVRLLLILLVFGTAVQISTMVFFSVVGGFGLFYVLFIVHLILLARHVNEQ